MMVQKTFQGDTILAEAAGSEQGTTNNRMELLAVISSLKAFRVMRGGVSRRATVHTDSQYVQKGITEWILAWKRNSWRTSSKQPVKNQDLWMELDALAQELSPEWEWVKGHAGNRYNEYCDRLTREEVKKILPKS